MKKSTHLTVKGNVIDRGQLKWGALMLPEHVRMLREWEADDPSNARPRLGEEEFRLLEEEIGIAYQRQCLVELHYWNTSHARVNGTIADIEIERRLLTVKTEKDFIQIAFTEIYAIRLLD